MRCIIVILLLIIVAAAPVRAEELSILGGLMQNAVTRESSYSWQVEYREYLFDHMKWSLSYLNEGHVPDHHRDGHALTLWVFKDIFDKQLTLSVGAGPYFYYDTTAALADGSYSDSHGWGSIYSLDAAWHIDSHWMLRMRGNFVETYNSIDTLSFLAGIGYQPAPKESATAVDNVSKLHGKTDKNEVTVFLGKTIVNSFGSEEATAVSVEYRRRLMQHLDWTGTWLYEGDNRLTRRNGIATQFWGIDEFPKERISLGVGAGAYIAADRYTGAGQEDPVSKFSVIATLTASYKFVQDWTLRTSWHRIVTNYDRDTDLLLVGVGYHF